jgi:hypothetical protein
MTDLVDLVLTVVADCLDRPKVRAGVGGTAIGGNMLVKMPQKFKPPEESFDDLVRRGRPSYDRAAIAAIAQEVASENDDESSGEYLDWVRDRLETRGMPVPKDTVLREICMPIYNRGRFGRE